MNTGYLVIIVWGIFAFAILAYTICRIRKRKALPRHLRSRSCSPGAVGAFYELLDEEKRRAVDIIVEQRAEERRPEYPDGNLPEK